MNKSLLALSGAVALNFAAAPALATEATDALFDALRFSDVIEIMHEEGVEYSEELAEDFFPGRTVAEWPDVIDVIYDKDRMETELRGYFSDALDGKDVEAMTAFFSDGVGAEAVTLEISARRAFMDEEIEAIANENAVIAASDETDRYLLIEEFIKANNIIESNVVGALNSNFAFFVGLMSSGAFGDDITEDQILADVWSSEGEIRVNTSEWAYSFLMMAYQPLSDDEVQTYIDFSKSPAGRQMNVALFEAYDQMLERISSELGAATGRYMMQQEL